MKHGFAAIAGVLVMMAVLGSLLFVASFLSIGESQAGLDFFRAEEARSLVEGCAEEALLRSRADETYAGGTIPLPEGECDATVGKDGARWTLVVSASRSGFLRRLEIAFDREPSGITLSHWREIE